MRGGKREYPSFFLLLSFYWGDILGTECEMKKVEVELRLKGSYGKKKGEGDQ